MPSVQELTDKMLQVKAYPLYNDITKITLDPHNYTAQLEEINKYNKLINILLLLLYNVLNHNIVLQKYVLQSNFFLQSITVVRQTLPCCVSQ